MNHQLPLLTNLNRKSNDANFGLLYPQKGLGCIKQTSYRIHKTGYMYCKCKFEKQTATHIVEKQRNRFLHGGMNELHKATIEPWTYKLEDLYNSIRNTHPILVNIF